MKKTLAAVAVLGAFAGSALAADVQLYGIVDTGLRYTHFDADSDAAGYDATDSFGIQSGNQSGSRFGFKGTEDLGNGLTVGFILENQFNSDDGSLTDDDHFFRRESSLFLQGGFGKLQWAAWAPSMAARAPGPSMACCPRSVHPETIPLRLVPGPSAAVCGTT